MHTHIPLLSLAAFVVAQQIGTQTPEQQPRLTTWQCTKAGGCVAQNTSVVLDASWRYKHAVDASGACNGNDCALEGVDYHAAGVSTSDASSSLTLSMYSNGQKSSPRVYLLAPGGQTYQPLRLGPGQELSFDVDMSRLPCGTNGALYLSEMDMTGGRSATNPAGASRGTGYCDAQCPVSEFINGVANTNGSGACCNEMDIWEANSRASALTAHACSVQGLHACSGTGCQDGSQGGVCDKSGCGFNAYKAGDTSFYGLHGTVDTTRPLTVVTQFLAGRRSALLRKRVRPRGQNAHNATLGEIRRLYLQDGILRANVTVAEAYEVAEPGRRGVSKRAVSALAITDEYCARTGSSVAAKMGGLATMGAALQRGMVLAFSIWDDGSQFMNWLDSGSAGPCSASEGDPSTLQSQHPDAAVTWSNVRWGEIGSTVASG